MLAQFNVQNRIQKSLSIHFPQIFLLIYFQGQRQKHPSVSFTLNTSILDSLFTLYDDKLYKQEFGS